MKSIIEDKMQETKATLDYVYDAVSIKIGHNQVSFLGKSIDTCIEEYQQALQIMGKVQKALVTQTIVDTIQR